MDLVYASDRHFNGGPPALESSNRHNPFKNILYKAARRLEDVHIAAARPIVIVGAKVPIIKFQDRITGIDVDISFENLSGVQAQATFDKWRKEYPDMIYMVALVKQFLVMRGLNEVHTGGLGGFSTICLIVSYIQHSDRPENLGDCFIGFLEYYGKKFDLSRQRIQMNPAAVVEKVRDMINSSVSATLTSHRQSMVSMAGQRGPMACPFKIRTDSTITSQEDRGGPRISSGHSVKPTTP